MNFFTELALGILIALGVVSFIFLKLISSEILGIKGALTTARHLIIESVEGLRTAPTEELKPLNNDALELEVDRLTGDLEDALANLRKALVRGDEYKASFNIRESELAKVQSINVQYANTIKELEHDILKLDSGVNAANVEVKVMRKDLEDLKHNYENLLSAYNSIVAKPTSKVNTIEVVTPTNTLTGELKQAIDPILDTLKSTTSPYEAGIHNGIASVMQNLYTECDYSLIKVPSTANVVVMPMAMPGRDSKGRFLKATA